MNDIKKGDIVFRKSYNKDVIFMVKNIIETKKNRIAILRGMIERIEADSDIQDLELVEKEELKIKLKELDDKLNERIVKMKQEVKDEGYKIGILTNNTRTKERIIAGKILHLDGDRKYSEKSYRYYRKLGLNAIVRNVPEYRQPRLVYRLLEMYNPDILVITRT
ncbi:MAG: hypothetical protein HFJ40_00725 [Clostridia bacterium]|nr:hypothetical protein [Clostridia bacterium]